MVTIEPIRSLDFEPGSSVHSAALPAAGRPTPRMVSIARASLRVTLGCIAAVVLVIFLALYVLARLASGDL